MNSKSRSRLSVAIITCNEASRIRRCLASVRWADEIVVVDTGSTDGTPAICREFTPWVYEYPWEGFARSKNRALAHTSGPWILSLDADEVVSEPLQAEILALLESPPTGIEGFYIPRKNFIWGKWIRHGGFYPDYQLRLFKRDAGRFAEKAVHESVTVTGKTGYLRSPLYHYTYRDSADLFARGERYATLAATELSGRERFRLSRLLWRPLGRFCKIFLVQRGFLDGIPGLILAGFYAFYVFQRYVKLWEMEKGYIGREEDTTSRKGSHLAHSPAREQSLVDRDRRSGAEPE
ncbi:MAG: glycosyltransferase family 2 protein [Nitrospinota bacterium]|nr:MAG: glycosyltransferase family 2 protein [Nitrospinota bacterium]